MMFRTWLRTVLWTVWICQAPVVLSVSKGRCVPGQTCLQGECYSRLRHDPSDPDILASTVRRVIQYSPMGADFRGNPQWLDAVARSLANSSVAAYGPTGNRLIDICICNSGYRGPKCGRGCEKGYRGPYCLHRCPTNCLDCDPDGTCKECRKGYQLHTEDAKKCSRSPCSPDTCLFGSCSEDGRCTCQDHVVGQLCETPCSNFDWPTWGSNCSTLCGRCTVQPCDVVLGHCKRPMDGRDLCEAGFQGAMCNAVDDNGLGTINIMAQLILDFSGSSDLPPAPIDSNASTGRLGILDEPTALMVELDRFLTQSLQRRAYFDSYEMYWNGSEIVAEFSIQVPSGELVNADALERDIASVLQYISPNFRSTVAPALRINKDTISTNLTSSVMDEIHLLHLRAQRHSQNRAFGSLLGAAGILMLVVVFILKLWARKGGEVERVYYVFKEDMGTGHVSIDVPQTNAGEVNN